MTPFKYTTAITAAGLIGSVVLLHGQFQWWCIGALLLAYLLISVIGVFQIRLNYFCDSVCRGKPGGKRVALTFDDGPDADATPALLDILKTRGAHATFFCIGERAQANGDIVRRIVKEGHTLGNHSYAHKWWTNFLAGAPLKTEILRTQQVLKDLSGIAPEYYRSPMGLTNPHLGPVLLETELKLVGWDVRPYDRFKPVKATTERVARAARDGSIVLLHDGGASSDNITAAVTEIIERLQGRGYIFVSLDELFKEQ
jgi:peptidoglycan/xylan/chitin deacetylase (PgdA/CDA1 family)